MSKCDVCCKEIPPGKELYQDEDGRFVPSDEDAAEDSSVVCMACARELVDPKHDTRKARRWQQKDS